MIPWVCLFKSLGVVYGDIGTSSLYVFSSTFNDGMMWHEDDILGVLSLILYTLKLIPLIKYIFIILRINDHGDGGTFALYSLMYRSAKMGLIPNQRAEDRNVSNYQLELPSKRLRTSRLKSELEKSQFGTKLGTSMVIGDGVLTPCISVLSALGGIKEAASSLTEGRIVLILVANLVCLFMVQKFGTKKAGYSFTTITCVWFDPTVINPSYIIDYFKRNKKQAWISLGGTVLAIIALFADVGHCTVRSMQTSMCTVTYPTLILAYVGQASFLCHHKDDVLDTFYKSIHPWSNVLANVYSSRLSVDHRKSSDDFEDIFYYPTIALVGVLPSHQDRAHLRQT